MKIFLFCKTLILIGLIYFDSSMSIRRIGIFNEFDRFSVDSIPWSPNLPSKSFLVRTIGEKGFSSTPIMIQIKNERIKFSERMKKDSGIRLYPIPGREKNTRKNKCFVTEVTPNCWKSLFEEIFYQDINDVTLNPGEDLKVSIWLEYGINGRLEKVWYYPQGSYNGRIFENYNSSEFIERFGGKMEWFISRFELIPNISPRYVNFIPQSERLYFQIPFKSKLY